MIGFYFKKDKLPWSRNKSIYHTENVKTEETFVNQQNAQKNKNGYTGEPGHTSSTDRKAFSNLLLPRFSLSTPDCIANKARLMTTK